MIVFLSLDKRQYHMTHLFLVHVLKLICSIPLKKSAFCLETSYFMNIEEPPGGNFASRAVWHTIAFKVPAYFWRGGGIPVFGSKTD